MSCPEGCPGSPYGTGCRFCYHGYVTWGEPPFPWGPFIVMMMVVALALLIGFSVTLGF